ncbi:MAG: type II secretion system protein GspG [Deltaproteobacteria bacterium GWA2_38_16]|nr:MAG: type II secretion system protein GspG [Deltaproteobacteria bacterium GWA2_38_16]OGQ03899.1 MAG: type II secretion system protein GspG [Deltaproteobacteria bacterium RIFCSPHIGHO2_02_FULL_38_15]OGQ30123.1 MAG: type II secretion system protein GspG [Deltaproteobacteria bacterium RIFCSPLOWO2_01_FULL_38_9]OGQ59948.1 MAG: type II secretion system protein GspG [Deltaproteobacteria bacterium RIFCSPLOWO2_12_FULL_38_8]HBQ20945.1 type II secretion system protein GspG [Deltaproteobacteria bacterium
MNKTLKLMNNRGMTLIEIIVVMTIIALFASLVATQVTSRLGQAKIQAAKTQIKTFQQAMELYKTDNDIYPTTEQGLEALIEQPTAGTVPNNYPPGGYLSQKKIPKDPWGSTYVYLCDDGEKFTILSYGPDRKEGGTGKGADISSDDQ